MIILHSHKLIFIKTRKTAGTSFEIALSKWANDDDTITPISPLDEGLRLSMGFRGPQNYVSGVGAEGKILKLKNHSSVSDVATFLGEDVFPGYI